MIEWLFPRRVLPEALLSTETWLGIFMGFVTGAGSVAVALNPVGEPTPLLFYSAVYALVMLRFVTWRVDVNTSPKTNKEEA